MQYLNLLNKTKNIDLVKRLKIMPNYQEFRNSMDRDPKHIKKPCLVFDVENVFLKPYMPELQQEVEAILQDKNWKRGYIMWKSNKK